MTALAIEALRLPPEDRLKLIEEVWESLAMKPESLPVPPAQLEELERRRARYLAAPDSLIDWQEMKSRLLQQRGDAH